MKEDTVYALSTAYGKAGVAIIRISGPKALNVAKEVCIDIRDELDFEPRKMYYCGVINPKTDEIIDKGLAVYFKAPNSFTGEDIVEINIHGSLAVINTVLNVLGEIKGIRLAEPGEFTKRAFENDKMDLTQVEGLADLIEAQTEAQLKQARHQMDGKLSEVINCWREKLVALLAKIEAAIDFSDEEIPKNLENQNEAEIQKLLKQMKTYFKEADKGIKLREGLNVSIVGAPNAGKSSLFNYILKEDRAIISSTPGTTRDVIEAYVDIKGYPVSIYDTAGIRETCEEIETEGIKRALKKAENADIKVLVSENEDNIFFKKELIDKNTIIVLNKIDQYDFNADNIKTRLKAENLKYLKLIPISIKKKKNLDKFIKSFNNTVTNSMQGTQEALITKQRHKNNLKNAMDYLNSALKENQYDLKAENIRLSADEIGKITGKIHVEELLDQIFSSFCIGK
jgi:tRNA modification GTPase